MKTSYKPEDVIVLLKDIATKKFYRKKKLEKKFFLFAKQLQVQSNPF